VTQGWQVDRAARDLMTSRGYGVAFRHRLGHSLGRNQAHGPCANLDDLETHDTRRLLPGLGVTVEPGVYLGHLGVRSEVNVLITETGATVTTPIQREPYWLGYASPT
jgi:Xaa-Pro aminopeptidase